MDNNSASSLDVISDFIDFRKLLSTLVENAVLIIVICVIFFSTWWAYVSYTTPQHR